MNFIQLPLYFLHNYYARSLTFLQVLYPTLDTSRFLAFLPSVQLETSVILVMQLLVVRVDSARLIPTVLIESFILNWINRNEKNQASLRTVEISFIERNKTRGRT